MTVQVVKRISIRWLPDPAYEDTDTIALNVGGYFIDLRVQKDNGSIQWSRAGKRRILKQLPLTCEWTHIIDSLGLTVPDVASFVKLPNGDDLEVGSYKNPNRGGALTEYEEIWRDITGYLGMGERAWIFQSIDGSTFLGKIGGNYVGISLGADGSFDARREERLRTDEEWKTVYKSVGAQRIPGAVRILSLLSKHQMFQISDKIELDGVSYVVRALEKTPN